MKGSDPYGAAIGERPCYRCHCVISNDLAQMSFNLLELDTVAEHLDLVVDSAQVVKSP
jgi:hypothetical protein